jgi:uncharacterized phage protein gp47/JayE/phage gp46-like protein
VPLSLRIDPKYLDADIVQLEDDVAATEAIFALCTDARVDEALLPAGKENRGHWADVFEREQSGSKCWLLEDQVVSVSVAERLDQYAREALAPIIDEGRLTAVETDEVIDGQHLDLVTRLTFPSGAQQTLSPIRASYEFFRPTLLELLTRVSGDIAARLGEHALIRRLVEKAMGHAVSGLAHHLHGHLAWVREQQFPQTASESALAEWADWLGEYRKAGARAAGQITVVGATSLPVGTLLQSDGGALFRSGSLVGPSTYLVEAVELGIAQNLGVGERLTFVSPVPGLESQTSVSLALSGGATLEDLEDWRPRVIDALRRGGFTGAEGDYQRYALRREGVTRAWEYDRRMGAGTVTLAFVFDGRSDIIPTADDITTMQAFFTGIRPADLWRLYIIPPVPNYLHLTITATGTATEADFEAELDDLLRADAELEEPIARSSIDEALSLVAGEQTHAITAISIVERGVPRSVSLLDAEVAPGSWGLLVLGSVTLTVGP